MAAPTARSSRIRKRRLALGLGIAATAAAAFGGGAAVAANAPGHATVHSYMTRDGSTMVSGYDGGVAVKP